MAINTLGDLISDVTISDDKKTITVHRLDGTESSFTFDEQLDMDSIDMNNGIFFQDFIDIEKDGVYISSDNKVSVVEHGEVFKKNIYESDNRMSLIESNLVDTVNGREVYSKDGLFDNAILGGVPSQIGVYIGSAVQMFTSPTSVSLQTDVDTINCYQNEDFAIVDEIFVGSRYYDGLKSSFLIDKLTVIGHSFDGSLNHVDIYSKIKTKIIDYIDAYSIQGSMFAWLKGNVVTVERIIGGKELFNKFPEAIIELENTPNMIALCDDMFIVGAIGNTMYLYDTSGRVVETSSVFNNIDAIAVDRRFNFIYAQDGKINMVSLYDNFVPVTSFLIQNYSRCPLSYQIGIAYKRTPSKSTILNLGYDIVDSAIRTNLELVTLTQTKLTKYTFVDNDPHKKTITATVVSPSILVSPLSVIAIGSYIYVSTIGSGNVLMAYNGTTLVREITQDVDLSNIIQGDNILSIATNTNGTISVLDSDYKVTIFNSILSQVIISSFYVITYTSYYSKVCSTDGKNILSSHITSKGTNMHTIFANDGSIDDMFSISIDRYAVPMVTGMRLFALTEDGLTLNEYLQETEIKVV